MREKKIEERLIKRLEEIYENTKVGIEIEGEEINAFEIVEGVRQECSLGVDLFNMAMSVLENKLKKVQGGGVSISIYAERVRSIAYTNDIAILAENEETLMRMLKAFERYIKIKGLEINMENTKMMCLRKAEGRKRVYEFCLGRKRLEVVKTFTYLGYELKGNNKEGNLIKRVKGKATGYLIRLEKKNEAFRDNDKRNYNVCSENILYINLSMRDTEEDGMDVKIGARLVRYKRKLIKKRWDR